MPTVLQLVHTLGALFRGAKLAKAQTPHNQGAPQRPDVVVAHAAAQLPPAHVLCAQL